MASEIFVICQESQRQRNDFLALHARPAKCILHVKVVPKDMHQEVELARCQAEIAVENPVVVQFPLNLPPMGLLRPIRPQSLRLVLLLGSP